MKGKITLLFLLLTTITLAQMAGPIGHLTIFSESGDKFYLILNGEQQNDIAQANIRIEDLNQPYYNGKIIFVDKNLTEISKSYIALTDADGVYQDVTYKIKKDKNNQSKMKLNFFSMIPVRQGYVPPANVYVVHYGQPQLNVGMQTNVNVGVNMNVNINDSHAGHEHDGHSHAGHSHDSHPNLTPKSCNNRLEMSGSDFSMGLASIKKQAFEETKLKTAKQLVAANCVSTNQISQLCKVFSFEDNKLELAQFAYDFCTDKKNYFKLNEIFSFSSNADALSDYIQNKN